MKKKNVILNFIILILVSFFTATNVVAKKDELHISTMIASDLCDEYLPVVNGTGGVVKALEANSPYGNTNNIKATSEEGYTFSFFLENNYVLSLSESYSFRTNDNHNILSFFRPSSKHQVLFVDANNTYLGSLLVEPGTIINESDIEKITARVTNKPGYEFAGWNHNLPFAAHNPLTIFKAQYNKTSTETATLTINSNYASTIIIEDIPYGSTVELIAPTPTPSFFIFSNWQINGEVLSYNPHHKISLYDDLTLTAHFEGSAPTPTPVSHLQETYIQDESRLYFFSQNYIPEDYSVIEQGLLLLDTEEKYNGNIDINTSDVVRLRANRVSPNNEFAVLKDTLHSDKIYYRAYLVVKNSTGEFEYFYSKQQEMSFKFTVNYNLNGGVNHPHNSNQYSLYDNKQLFTPTKTGYEFDGWYLDDDFKQLITDVSSLITDTTLYAKWNYITHNINYETNGGIFNFGKEELINEFLLDYYDFCSPEMTFTEFIHSSSEEEDFRGPWRDYRLFQGSYKNIIDYLYANGDKNIYENSQYFLNDYRYNAKWLPFFEMIAEFSNDTTTFWSSPELGSHEIYLYITKRKYQEENMLPENFSSYPPKYYTSQAGLRLPTPIKDGFKFAGWYDNENFDGSVITKINPGEEGARQYYAKWTEEGLEEEFTINYNLNGGTLLEEGNSFTQSDLPLTLPIPVKDGYEFIGWFLDEEFTDWVTEIIEPKNQYLFANWRFINDYTISYELEGGILENKIKTYMQLDLPLQIDNPTKEGYQFLGWYLDADYAVSLDKLVEANHITLFAKWDKITKTISYSLNEGTLKDEINEFTILDLPLSLPIPTKDHYKFIGWYLDKNYTSEKVSEINTLENYQLYAKWDACEYSVIYDLDGGVLNNQITIFTIESLPLTLPTPTKEHFNFRGWYDNKDFSGSNISEITNGQDYHLYAKWEAVTYRIDYELNDGILRNQKNQYTINDLPLTLQAPTKAHHQFEGWYLQSDFSGLKITTITESIIGAMKLYAKWTEKEYTITYNLNGGSLQNPISKYAIGNLPIDLPTPTRKNYVFKGWYFNANLTGTSISVITNADLTNIELYAKWEAIEYKITYELNGGTLSSPTINFTVEDLPFILKSPNKHHFTFSGWYDNANFNGSKITKIEDAENYKLFAKWDADKYNIKYDLNGGTLANPKTTYTQADLPLTLQTPTKESYKFEGWYLNSNFSGSKLTKIEVSNIGNIKLYAKWTLNEFLVEYELNGGKWSIASKDDLKKDFLTDFYNYLNPSESLSDFMHGKGKTSGYQGTWAKEVVDEDNNKSIIIERLYEANSKGVDASKDFFINQPEYNSKWVPFFNMIDEWTTETNEKQDLWSSTWIGNIRLHEYITGARWADRNDIPSNLPGISDYQRKYTPDSLPLSLPIPTKTGTVFEGWYDNPNFTGSKVTTIAKGATGNKKFYAKWLVKPYNITYVLNGGSWYTSKNDMKNDFLSDFYNFLGKPGGNLTTFRHGAGKTSGYNGTWHDYTDELYNPNDKTENPSKDKFINQIEYNKKWLPFFNYMDTLVKETNPNQSFWGSVFEGTTRLKEYMNEERYSDKKTIPNVVKAPSIYYGGQGLSSLMEPKNGSIKFLGWYDNANFSGSKVTSIPSSANGNKTFYAKWDIVAPPKGSVYLRLNYSGNGTLEVGKKVRITYTAVVTGSSLPADPVKWSSSNTSVATVDQNGNVTAKKAGHTIITAETVASGAKSQAGITVYTSNTNAILKYLISQNNGILWSRTINYYGGTTYSNRISNTVNKFLNEPLNITEMPLASNRSNNPNAKMPSLKYITVHDTGNSAAGATARANGTFLVNSSEQASWHFTVGNDGVFRHLPDNNRAWHAGDGSRTVGSARDSGIKGDEYKKPAVTRKSGKVYINGKETPFSASIQIPEGILFTIGSNGNYHMYATHTMGGMICNAGGNYGAIGIEMAVNTGSNMYYTWQRAAKLVAYLANRNNMALSQVGFHRNFSGKMCPQTMIRANLQREFWDLVEAEFYIKKKYPNATISFTSHNTSLINNKGQIVKYPTYQTNVDYTITVKNGGSTYTAKLSALVPGTKDR